MAFVSSGFLLFVLIVTIVYFIVPKKIRWIVLLTASYVFFVMNSFFLVFFLVGTTIFTYLLGLWMQKITSGTKEAIKAHKEWSRDDKKEYKARRGKVKKFIVFLSFFGVLGLLVFLKYSPFIVKCGTSLINLMGLNLPNLNFSFMLPLGISFYSLQAVAYIIDLYRDKYQADRNPFKFALFMSFFPQIVQGPIARYDQLAHQLYEGHKFSYDNLTKGAQLILWGFMKKLILAERIGIIADEVFNNYNNYSGFMLFIGATAYGLQVYADFSAGMDIARGVAKIFGIDLVENFQRPYFACSISEFWRRWHITLGGWMRDYIFYPLSFSKAFNKMGKGLKKVFGNFIGKKFPTFLAMFIVFMMVGIWHGSSMNYIAYGLWNGIIISSSILLEPVYARIAKFFHVNTEDYGWKFIAMLRTFVLCSFGRFFSRADSASIAIKMFVKTITNFNPWVLTDGSLMNLGVTGLDYALIAIMLAILLVVGIVQERGVHIRDSIASQNLIFRWLIYISAFVFVLLAGVYGPGYNAADFIYQQF